MPVQNRSDNAVRTRRKVLELLKQRGPQDAQTLADEIGVSPMAVRQHLYDLEAEKLVTHTQDPRPMGRPAKLWRLTKQADRFFPDGHASLAVDLIGSLVGEFGSSGMDRLIAARTREQIARYRESIVGKTSLRRRLDKLAVLRTEEGYMAQVLPQKDGSYLLVENHCPICTAATACTGLCAAEFEVFQKVLGPAVAIERTEHIIAGARRCAYRVRGTKKRRK